MPSLPPPVWAELRYSNGGWDDITGDVRVTTAPVTVTRGLTSESASTAAPTSCTCDLDSRDYRYAPRNPNSELFGLIGRNTGFRWGYEVGSPWAVLPGGLDYSALFVLDAPALDVTGDFDLRLDLALEDWSESQMLALRYQSTGDQRSWVLEILDGVPTFLWSPNGLLASRITQAATEAVRGYNGQRMALRVTLDINNGAGGYELRFYTGRTVDDEEWALLGSPIVGAAPTSVFAGSGYMEFGAGFNFNATPGGGSLNRMRGNAYALQLRDGGTVKVNMSTAAAAVTDTSFTDSTGLTWSRGGNAVFSTRHTRMAGEVPAWPPTRDLSGNDNYVSINPSGVMRRMDAGNRPQDSALLRYIKAQGPVQCWPLTDGPRTTGPRSLVGSHDMQLLIEAGLDTPPDWQKGSLADWIEPVILVKADTTGGLRGGVPALPVSGGAWSVDLFLTGGGAPSMGQFIVTDRGAGTDANPKNKITTIFGGSPDRLTIIRDSYTTDSSSAALLANIDNTGSYDENPHHLRLSITPAAPDTLWSMYADGQLVGSGVIAGIIMADPGAVELGWGYATLAGITMTDRSFGYITVWDAAGPSASEIYDAYMGYQGEKAGARIERLATEAGYTATVAGETTFQRPMGIQSRRKLLDLLNDASRTNFGYLVDARDRGEVIHRGHSTLWNQTPGLTLDFDAGLISPPFKPVDDDRLTENDVTVRREYGSLPAWEVLEEGDMSVLPPEDGGVGRYDTSHTYSLYTDAQAAQVAGMRLHLGTYNGVRYTRITLNLANERVFEHIDDILRLDVGDTIRLTNLPADHGPDDVDVLITGYSEEAGPNGWTISFNCVPGQPWTAGVVGSDTYGHVDTAGCELAEALDATSTAVDVVTTALARWVDSAAYGSDLPFDVRTGGEVMHVVIIGPVLNANPTFETGTSDWSPTNATLERTSEVTRRGGYSGKLTTTAGSNPRATSGLDAVVAGQPYTVAGWLYTPAALPTAAAININWYTAASAYLSTSSNSVTLTAGAWTRLSKSFTAPATAAFGAVVITISGTPGAGHTLYAQDAVLIDDTANDSDTQTMHVVRGINGVSRAHAAGQPISLAAPVYVSL